MIDRRFQVEVVNRAKKPKTGSAATNLSDSLGLADDTFKYLNSYNMDGHRLSNTSSYLSKMLPESNITDEKLKRFVKNLPDFIDNYVSPRGFLPSLYLSNMPYGVLPTTNFADLSFIKQNDVKDDEMFVVDMLEHLLRNLSTAWDRAFHNNVHSMDNLKGKNNETSETNFMKLISAMPHSVDYKALEMMKNSLLLKDFTFKGNYKKLDSSSIRKYFKYAPENMVEKLDYFSYFPNAKMQRVELEDILTKIKESVSDNSKSELIDLISYRLDAWFMALANYQLEQQRD